MAERKRTRIFFIVYYTCRNLGIERNFLIVNIKAVLWSFFIVLNFCCFAIGICGQVHDVEAMSIGIDIQLQDTIFHNSVVS